MIVGSALAAGVLLAAAGCHSEEERKPPRVQKQLKSDSPAVRGEAARAAAQLGGEAKEVTGDLIEALKAERDASVRGKLIVALGEAASQAKPAEQSREIVPALIDTLGDENAMVRNRARQALAKIGPAAGTAVSKLVEGLKAENVDEQWWTLTALGGMAEKGGVAIGEIAAFLDSTEPRLRARAVWALGKIGPAAKETIPRLTALTKDDSGDVRAEAADALGLMGREAESALGALAEMQDHDPITDNRSAAARAIKRIRGE